MATRNPGGSGAKPWIEERASKIAKNTGRRARKRDERVAITRQFLFAPTWALEPERAGISPPEVPVPPGVRDVYGRRCGRGEHVDLQVLLAVPLVAVHGGHRAHDVVVAERPRQRVVAGVARAPRGVSAPVTSISALRVRR